MANYTDYKKVDGAALPDGVITDAKINSNVSEYLEYSVGLRKYVVCFWWMLSLDSTQRCKTSHI